MERMARPSDVLFFTDSRGFGGAEKALLTLIRGLERVRWLPALVFDQAVTAKPLVEGAADASCELIQAQAMPEGLVGARRALRFAAALRRRRPEVFHAHLTWPLACKFGLAAAVAARVPAVLATHQLVPPFVLRRRALVQQRVLGSMVGCQIAVSEDIAARLVDLFGWPRQRITVVHNGIPVPGERPEVDAALRAQLLAGYRAIVLVPARLDPLKGHEFLLEAARELERVHVVVAGEGSERPRLEGLADRLGIRGRVTFLGFREDVSRLTACADVVVLPSLAEGLPLAVLEAMSVGTPLVATAIGGTDEAVVDGVTGLLVPPRDAAALAGAVERVLANPEEAKRRAETAAVRVAVEFSASRMVAGVESVYEELLIGRERRAGR
jgi:glycosyltransferase involved in cell wall biosynthesis